MLLELEKPFSKFLPLELLRATDGRELYRARLADGPEGYYLLVVSENRSLIEGELSSLSLMKPVVEMCLPHESIADDRLAAYAAEIPAGAVRFDEYLAKNGPLRAQVALPLMLQLLHILSELSYELPLPSVSPDSFYYLPPTDSAGEGSLLLGPVNPPLRPEDDADYSIVKYYPPEQIESGKVTERSAIYSATLILIQMLQGSLTWAFPKPDQVSPDKYSASLRDVLSRPAKVDIPAPLRRIINPNVDADPERRLSFTETFNAIFGVMKSYGYCTSDYAPEPSESSEDSEPSESSEPASDFRPSKFTGREPKPSVPSGSGDSPKGSPEISRVEGPGFADVAGLEDVKKKMSRNFISIVRNPELAKQFRIVPPNGLLLWGPPGNGKSFISRKLAEESGLLYTLVNPADLGSIYVHGTQGMIADLFKRCEDMARKEKTGVLMVLEEFDALVPNRASQTAGNNRSDEVAEFLTRLNNCAEKGVYVVATTNRIDAIDPAVMRKGRIDEVIYIGLPDEKVRSTLFNLELRDRPHAELDLNRLVKLTDGFTSGDIAFLVKESARRSFELSLSTPDKSVVPISQEILEATIREATPSVTAAERRSYEKLREQYDRHRNENPRVGF